MGTASIISLIGALVGTAITGAQAIDKGINGGHSGVSQGLGIANNFNEKAVQFGQLFSQLKSIGGK